MGTAVESWQGWAWLRPHPCLWQGIVAVLHIFPARVLPGPCERPRQEACRGLAAVFGKGPCRGLVGILGKEPCGRLVFWFSGLAASFCLVSVLPGRVGCSLPGRWLESCL